MGRGVGASRSAWTAAKNAAAGSALADGSPALDALVDVPKKFDPKKVTEWLALAENFDSPLWKEFSLGCLGCGACAYTCPVCHCFDIVDEKHGAEGLRAPGERENHKAHQADARD